MQSIWPHMMFLTDFQSSHTCHSIINDLHHKVSTFSNLFIIFFLISRRLLKNWWQLFVMFFFRKRKSEQTDFYSFLCWLGCLTECHFVIVHTRSHTKNVNIIFTSQCKKKLMTNEKKATNRRPKWSNQIKKKKRKEKKQMTNGIFNGMAHISILYTAL